MDPGQEGWIGFDRPRPIVEDATGGELAAPVWARVMREHATAGVWPTPSTVVQLPIDPVSGLVLVEGCEPEIGQPRTELFAAGNEPASACPAGQPQVEERGLLSRFGAWLGRRWGAFERWATRHFGSEEPQHTPREGDYLGVPRLPRAAEIAEPQVEADSFKPPLGTPIGMPRDTTPADTLRVDTLRVDTLRIDTLRFDTLHADTLRPDTLRPDALRRDTIPLSQ